MARLYKASVPFFLRLCPPGCPFVSLPARWGLQRAELSLSADSQSGGGVDFAIPGETSPFSPPQPSRPFQITSQPCQLFKVKHSMSGCIAQFFKRSSLKKKNNTHNLKLEYPLQTHIWKWVITNNTRLFRFMATVSWLCLYLFIYF